MKLFNLRSLLFTIFTITASMFTLWLYILFTFNPYDSNVGVLSAFYLTFYIFLGGFLTFFIYFCKINFTNNEIIYEILPPSLRQGYILSAIFVISLILKGLGIFNWFEFIIVISIGVIAELYFKSKNARNLSSHH